MVVKQGVDLLEAKEIRTLMVHAHINNEVRKRSPVNSYGKITHGICEPIYHWVKECPHNESGLHSNSKVPFLLKRLRNVLWKTFWEKYQTLDNSRLIEVFLAIDNLCNKSLVEKVKIAMKLQKQLGHPKCSRFINLIKSAEYQIFYCLMQLKV